MTLRQVTYTSPTTWTWPGNISHVEVILVGGGGGAGTKPGPVVSLASTGGGGGIRLLSSVPVTGPVPIVVGAAGTMGPPTNTPTGWSVTTVGGTSSFGAYSVDGGGRGYDLDADAPPDGGGGGLAPPSTTGLNGSYGIGNPDGAGVGGGTGFTRVPYMSSVEVEGFEFSCVAPPPSTAYKTWGWDKRAYGCGGQGSTITTPITPSVQGCVIVKWFE